MPAIEPLPLEQLDEHLHAQILEGQATRMLSSIVPVQIWAYRPGLASVWLETMAEIHLRGTLDERLRELVRLKIAGITSCRACMLGRKSDRVSEEDVACLNSDDGRFTEAEQAALHFAELFATDYTSIDEQEFVELGRHFTNEQIVELGMFAGLMMAGGRFAYAYRGYVDDEGPTVLERLRDAPVATVAPV